MSQPRCFDPPISASNLVLPARERVLDYAHRAWLGEPIVALLEERLAAFHRTKFCVALCNGFWALVLAMRLLATPGRTDVLLPSLTYRRMADAVSWAGLRPRFCEVEPTSLACSPITMRAALAPDVGLLLGVHPIVNQCDAAGLEALAADAGLPLLFDAVESVFEWVGGRKVGSFGRAECFSLHASKLLNGCEGGYVTTGDVVLARELREARDGQCQGLDLRLNAFHAAFALASLDDLPDQVERNRRRYELYRQLFAGLPGLRLLHFDEAGPTSFKTIVAEVTDDWPLTRDQTVAGLNGAGVLARAYYAPPLHAKAMQYAFVPAALPVTEELAQRFMLLPCGHHVTLDDIAATVRLLASMRP